MPLAKSNELEIFYECFAGKTRAGKPVPEKFPARSRKENLILIMGIGAQSVFWPDEFCGALARNDINVIRFDHRDIGRSTRFNHLGLPNIRRLMGRRALGLSVDAPYDLGDMADDVFGMMDALKIPRAHIVGLSMGGMVGQTMAIRRPERMKSLTSIMSTTGQRRHALGKPHALRALLAPPARNVQQAIERTLRLFRIIGSPGYEFDDDLLRDAAARAYEHRGNPSGSARHMAAILRSGSRVPALRSVHIPTLVMHGLEDPLVLPSGGIATARAIPSARLKLFRGLGHDLPRGIWPEWIRLIRELVFEDARLRR